VLTSKGYYPATLRSLFGDVPVQVRRLLVCPCQSAEGVKSFAVLDLAAATVTPELAYVTARYAALMPFGKAASLLAELLPISGAVNAGTVRNRTMRLGQNVVPPHPIPMEPLNAPQPVEAVVVGLDGGYVRSRHRQEARHFEVIAGRVFHTDGTQSRFAFVRNGPTRAGDAFKQVLAVAGVQADTPATVLCDGDAGLWRLQREALPGAMMVLDWWHAAVHFEHALQAARSLGAGTIDTSAADAAVRGLERAKWSLWHGRWPGCRRKLGLSAAGRSDRSFTTWLASAAFSETSASCWATSSATRMRWSTMPRGGSEVSRSRRRSSRARSTRLSPNA
jgi:hypothetical protein